jgi:hypothetical protein
VQRWKKVTTRVCSCLAEEAPANQTGARRTQHGRIVLSWRCGGRALRVACKLAEALKVCKIHTNVSNRRKQLYIGWHIVRILLRFVA